MGKDLTTVTNTVFVCNGGTCKKSNSEKIIQELRCAIKIAGLQKTTHTVKTYCIGQCEDAPVVLVLPNNTYYKKMHLGMVPHLVNDKLKNKVDLPLNVLFKSGESKMFHAKDIIPKMQGEFISNQVGINKNTKVASIYPWEQNTYPLFKELFQNYRSLFLIKYKNSILQSSTFNINYENGIIYVLGNIESEYFAIPLIGAKGTEHFLQRISNVKVYFYTIENSCELALANSSEGVILKFTWPYNEIFWNHLISNYISITG